MAALYGILDPNGSRAQVTRTAHHTIDSTLKTHNTNVSTVLHKDGSGYTMVWRGSQQFRVDWAAEPSERYAAFLNATCGTLEPELSANSEVR